MTERMDRPAGVPVTYVWVERILGTYQSDEEADAVLGAWEPPLRAMEPEVTINRTDAGQQAIVGYWAPPDEKGKPIWPWILGGVAAVGLLGTIIVVGTRKQRRRSRRK